VLDVLDPAPGPGVLVLADPPHDRATWEALTTQADTLVLAWAPRAEAALTTEVLGELYMDLANEPALTLTQLVARQAPERQQGAIAALRILKAAGLLVERSGRHQLLAAPDGEIALGQLPAFQEAGEAERFRAWAADAPAAALAVGRALACI
jgi:hypothetical protein